MVNEVQSHVTENRVVSCRAASAMGLDLRPGGPCYDASVLPLYEPEAERGLVACTVAAEMGAPLSDRCRVLLDATAE